MVVIWWTASHCAMVFAQELRFDYSPKDENAYCVRVSWQGGSSPRQLLIGIRDKDKDYGPYKRLELIRVNQSQQFKKTIVLETSKPTIEPEVLADFSATGTLWFASIEENKIRITKVLDGERGDREFQFRKEISSDLKLFKLRAVSDTEIWLVGRQGSEGIILRLSDLSNKLDILHIPLEPVLKDAFPTSQSEYLVAGTNVADTNSKSLPSTTHLNLMQVGGMVRTQAASLPGLLQDVLQVNPNGVAVLTSKLIPGELSLHLLSKTLAVTASTVFLNDRSFTGGASLTSHQDLVIAYTSNLGKCFVSLFASDSGRLIKHESIESGSDRCIDIRAAQSGNQILLATTQWRLNGSTIHVGVRTSMRSTNDLMTEAVTRKKSQ